MDVFFLIIWTIFAICILPLAWMCVMFIIGTIHHPMGNMMQFLCMLLFMIGSSFIVLKGFGFILAPFKSDITAQKDSRYNYESLGKFRGFLLVSWVLLYFLFLAPLFLNYGLLWLAIGLGALGSVIVYWLTAK